MEITITGNNINISFCLQKTWRWQRSKDYPS